LVDIIQKVDNCRGVLDFLVTSKARRRLLDLLWRQDATGSTAQLAARARVGFASAYRELLAMHAQGLVTAERQGSAHVYRANRTHPLAGALHALVAAPAARPPDDPAARRVRSQLAALGAPVQHEGVDSHGGGSTEETVVHGMHFAHRDPDVARSLPVCLYRQRDALDPVRLREHAIRLGEKRSLGFFLALTAELSGDRRFVAWTKPLRDRRWHAPRDFFYTASRSRRRRQLADERTPSVARRWGWRMNMDLDVFRATFEKFVPHDAA
jgi:hypothetical protein